MTVLTLIGEGAADAAESWRRELRAQRVYDLGGAAEMEAALSYADLREWVRTNARPSGMDVAAIPPGPRVKRLLLADMDSTVIEQECLDELAAIAGHGEAVAAITERAMRGELDFEAALTERVAMLEGLPIAAVDHLLRERITLSPGAEVLVATMKAHGASCVLVSGGFTAFTGPVAERAGFDAHHGNTLEVKDGKLTGRVVPPVLGREAKREQLDRLLAYGGLGEDDALCVGDGANDLAMIQAAGLGVAYRAKPVVACAAPVSILHGDLTALLHLQGVPRAEWVAP